MLKNACFLKKSDNAVAFEETDTTGTGKLLPKNGKYYVVVIGTDNPDITNINVEKRLIREALQEIEAEIKYDIKVYTREEFLTYPNTVSQIDVTIDYLSNDPYFTPNILAYAGYPVGSLRGKLVFNNAHPWFDGYPKTGAELRALGLILPNMVDTIKYTTYNVRQTTKHEFGHILGLPHNAIDDESVMQPIYRFDRVMLGLKDKLILKTKYGDPDLTKNIRKVFSYIKRVMLRPL